MAVTSYCEKLEAAPLGAFYVLEPEKAQRMKAATMYVPSPADLTKVLNTIPAGETISHEDLKQKLADLGKAEIACPMMTTRYWSWIAAASAEPGYELTPYNAPWWRVIKDGKPVKALPGGVFSQEERLKEDSRITT